MNSHFSFAGNDLNGPPECNGKSGDQEDFWQSLTRVPPYTGIQLSLSFGLGMVSFLTFCLLRLRWTGLYAARKKQKNAAAKLPELPRSFFGWIPVLFSITEEEVLASAGLDAFVFLRFFKLAIKYLLFVLFFVLTVIWPAHSRKSDIRDGRKREASTLVVLHSDGNDNPTIYAATAHLWMYVVFAYLFTAAAMYIIVVETNHVIKVRQRYLSTHSTVTNRTIRLSGIPKHLRSEEAVKETIENLKIGKVEAVTLCKNWQELDSLVEQRMSGLRKLEEAWTVHLGTSKRERARLSTLRPSETSNQENEDIETSGLLGADAHLNSVPSMKTRPTTRIWYGFLKLKSKKIDAIDYYEAQLQRLDQKIKNARTKERDPASIAFVTLDSVVACQMAIQAIIAPAPMQLIANPAPAPEDVVWKNTYLTRKSRIIKAWAITLVVALLTFVWWTVFLPLSVFLNLNAIGKISPQIKDFLCAHKQAASLVSTTLPSLVLSLMLVLVPYLYDWLSSLQGMTSQSDAEMTVIAKNFFFTFFNLFVSFTIFGTASNLFSTPLKDILEKFGPQAVLQVLADSLVNLSGFYSNLILLQAIGLSPFRLLEFGSVALYPIGLMGSKTPRDYAELMYPPIFSYGFYLPQILFIFLICIVYSILPNSQLMLVYGLIYFLISAFVYKYQLLYAMDHRNFSTGRAWTMICNRVTVALIVFQLTTASQLVFNNTFIRAVLMIPLIAATVWFLNVYSRTYEPLMNFISLKSLRDAEVDTTSNDHSRMGAQDNSGGIDIAESYVNPSLVMPLENVWISKKGATFVARGDNDSEEPITEV